MSQKHDSMSSPPRADASASGRKKRLLPQIPMQSHTTTPSTLVARGNETTINLTTVTELSTVSILNQSGGQPDGIGPHTREFVSPVRFTDGEDSCVTVAVRVRPFSQRELDLPQAKPIIRMHGNEVIIKSKDDVVHRFYYDHCFWSVPETSSGDSWGGRRDLTPTFADQEYVYKELAQPLLDRSFEGYNTCLFAYGQTGSGKSYCIMGEGEAIGIVPRFAQELFDRIEGTADEESSFKVQVSYYEIFKEKIYDLLASTQNKVKKKLRVREHPVLGPYVEDLSTFVADSYPDIERWIHLGNRFRATAATGMNERSSRSHSVFTITLTQTMMFEGEDQSKVSRINLIDLAGSERSSVSKTSGERLKEGASINKSLHSLGKVISLLSEKGSGRRKKVFIPYRDSTLTWLLKESLGGNSKTAMIATVSPSHLHYDESLSTLRYAQQARTIVNVARINEDPNGAIIRDLRQQIADLKVLLQSTTMSQDDSSDLRSLRERLLESEKLMADTTRSWQEKLRQSEARKQEEVEQLKRSGALTVNNRQPNLVNLTEDPQLSEIVVYFLKEGVTRIGGRGESGSHDIELLGALVTADHCSISNECGKVALHPSPNTEAQTYLNGELIATSTQLHHGDRIVLGGEYFFRFNHPLEVEQGSARLKKGQGTFEYAKNELIRAQTARLEAELEERRLKEREALMTEYQLLKDAAQKDIDDQKEAYEEKMSRLTRELAEQSMEASHHMRSSEEAQARMEELLERNRALEEETMTQKHLIHLEKLKAEREYEEIKEEKTRLMTDLEQERNKLVADIQQLNKNKVLRTTASRHESTVSPASNEPTMRGSEMVRLAMMLQEASAISKSFNRPLTFSREEFTNDTGSLEVQVRVNNTAEGLVTFWSLDKFESRLELMRDMYNSSAVSGVGGSVTSLEGEGSSTEVLDGDPFIDPTDSWVKESLLTPHPSPMRSSSVRGLLMSSSSTHSTGTLPTFTHPPRSLLEMLNSSFVSSRGGSPIVPPRSDPSPLPSLTTLCHQQISSLLHVGVGVASHPRSVFQALLTQVLAIRKSSDTIEEAFNEHSSQVEGSVPFSSTTAVSQSILSLYTSLELLLSTGQALYREMLIWQGLLARLLPDYWSEGLVKEKAEELLGTISQQTALYCSRLLQAVDKETEDGIRDACVSLRESLDSLTQQTGSLSLARRVMSKTLHSRVTSATPPSSDDVEWVGEDDFLTLQPYQKSAVSFYQGFSDWCTLTFEHAHQQVKECLDSLSEHDNTSENGLVSGVLKELGAVEVFLGKLAEMQADIWSISSSGDGTLPLTPPLPSTVDLLAHLQQVERAIDSITAHTRPLTHTDSHTNSSANLETLSSSNKQVAYCCNELAALTLRVISGSPSPQSQGHVSEVQQLSHEIARAGKTVNHTIKKGGGKERVKKKSNDRKPVDRIAGQTETAPDTPTVAAEPNPSTQPNTTTASTTTVLHTAPTSTASSICATPSTSAASSTSALPDATIVPVLSNPSVLPTATLAPHVTVVEPTVAIVTSVPVVEEGSNSAALNESRTSMATGQLTQSPEHVTVNGCHERVVKNHVTSKEDHMTTAPDVYSNYDDDDSTLI